MSITHSKFDNHIIKLIIKCKEVIQPQVPLRLPCYDFTLLKKPRFEYDKNITSSSKPFLGGVTGGVCKEQGRIHRAIVIRDYYAFQLHENELQSSIRTTTKFRGLPPPFGVGTHCLSHCSPRVAQRIRGIRTYRRPLLPPIYHRRSP